jgi:hypothetical protein
MTTAVGATCETVGQSPTGQLAPANAPKDPPPRPTQEPAHLKVLLGVRRRVEHHPQARDRVHHSALEVVKGVGGCGESAPVPIHPIQRQASLNMIF